MNGWRELTNDRGPLQGCIALFQTI